MLASLIPVLPGRRLAEAYSGSRYS
jgi:hypothetical protein